MGDIVKGTLDAVGSIFGAKAQGDATKQAAQTSADASRDVANLQYKMWQEQQALQAPWREAGVRALPQLEGRVNAMPGAFSFTAQDFNKFQDPGYAFRLAEGNKELNQSAAARGGLISGNALRAAQRYGQEMGSQEFGNAYKRALDAYNSQITREQTGYNRLAGLAGIGQQTAGTLASQAGQYGTNVGNLAMTNAANQGNALLSQGNARASAYGGVAKALGGVDWGKYFGSDSSSNDNGGWGAGSGNDWATRDVQDTAPNSLF